MGQPPIKFKGLPTKPARLTSMASANVEATTSARLSLSSRLRDRLSVILLHSLTKESILKKQKEKLECNVMHYIM